MNSLGVTQNYSIERLWPRDIRLNKLYEKAYYQTAINYGTTLPWFSGLLRESEPERKNIRIQFRGWKSIICLEVTTVGSRLYKR